MGARAQVKIGKVYLYTHWGADTIEATVKKAVTSEAGARRIGDNEYLARIIFCEMVKDAYSDETGYGIGTEMHGDIEKLVIVDDNGNITIE